MQQGPFAGFDSAKAECVKIDAAFEGRKFTSPFAVEQEVAKGILGQAFVGAGVFCGE